MSPSSRSSTRPTRPTRKTNSRKASAANKGAAYGKEKTFKIALHVYNSAKRNDSPPIKAVDNPFIATRSFNTRTALSEVIDYISLEVINEESFNNRYTGCMIDLITGLMLLKRVTKNDDSDVSVKALLNKRKKVFIHESHGTEDKQEWKSFIKTSMRSVTKGKTKTLVLDIGIAVYSPPRMRHHPPTSVTKTTKKKKKKDQPLPDVLRINILQPVHCSKKNSDLRTLSTTVLKTIDIDFHPWIESSMDTSIELSSSSDSDEETNQVVEKKYANHGMILPVRNHVANGILNNEHCAKVYEGVLGKKVSLSMESSLSVIYIYIFLTNIDICIL